ncbi:hypothetical protein DPMN_111517 [Dreissena polymorpha]|uniref:Uncharacterized protein n=1 Tax=Dreissena polymorpha TaxID=45954 RepID=A0A9D4QNW6_DREPO|nr:hypothetical protein DPMN_111517 [Dreissena polymorpha]
MNLLTKKNAPPLGSHVFQANVTIFDLIQDIIETNLLTKFHEDWTINVASRVLTRFYYSHLRKTAPPPGGHFHDNWAKIVTYRVFTRKTAPPPGGHLHKDWPSNVTSTVFTSFKLNQTIKVASRVFTRQNVDDARRTTDKRRSQKVTMSTLCSEGGIMWGVVEAWVLTRKYAPPPGSHVFQPTGIIFELIQDIIGMNLLTKFHEDRTVNVASRVLTRFYYSHIRKNARPLGSLFFSSKHNYFRTHPRYH